MFPSAVKFYSILFPAMAESELPTTGGELDLNNEIRVTGERESNRKTLLRNNFEAVVMFSGGIVKYIFSGHYQERQVWDWKYSGNPHNDSKWPMTSRKKGSEHQF